MNDDETSTVRRVRLTFLTLVLSSTLLSVAAFDYRGIRVDLWLLALLFNAGLLAPAIVILLLRKNALVVTLYGLVAIPVTLCIAYSALPPHLTSHARLPDELPYLSVYAFYIPSLFAILMLVAWKVAWRGTSGSAEGKSTARPNMIDTFPRRSP
jgi:hypothetical protein